MTYLAIFVFTLLHVGLRAFQSINVVGLHWLRVPPTGLGIALAEVVVVGGVVSQGFGAVLPMALGGWAGAWAAMFIHREIERAKARAE